jgi:hypothetical protein
VTVIFAFCSPERRHSAICADDLEANNGDLVAKVMIAFDRYGVGVIGPGFLKTALERVCAETSRTPSSAMDLARDVYRLVPGLAHEENTALESALRSDPTKEEQARHWRGQTGALVVLDVHGHQLYHARAGQTVAALLSRPAAAPAAFSVRALRGELAFEIAKNASDGWTIPASAFEDHRSWGREEIARAAEEINRKEQRVAIGKLGASVVGVERELRCWPAIEEGLGDGE